MVLQLRLGIELLVALWLGNSYEVFFFFGVGSWRCFARSYRLEDLGGYFSLQLQNGKLNPTVPKGRTFQYGFHACNKLNCANEQKQSAVILNISIANQHFSHLNVETQRGLHRT
jgi:hypothetical protein